MNRCFYYPLSDQHETPLEGDHVVPECSVEAVQTWHARTYSHRTNGWACLSWSGMRRQKRVSDRSTYGAVLENHCTVAGGLGGRVSLSNPCFTRTLVYIKQGDA